MFLGAAALAGLFNWLLLLYPKELLRELILPLLLLPAVVGSVKWEDARGSRAPRRTKGHLRLRPRIERKKLPSTV